jgi:hypothetical protein
MDDAEFRLISMLNLLIASTLGIKLATNKLFESHFYSQATRSKPAFDQYYTPIQLLFHEAGFFQAIEPLIPF